MDYFNYCTGLTMTSRKFDDVFGGPPRKAESKFGQREMDLARSIQEVTEEVMLRLSRTMHQETGVDYLCLAGGVALNCVGNGRVLREGPFKGIWIQPAAGDAGGALGAALSAWHRLENERPGRDRRPRRNAGSLSGAGLLRNEGRAFLSKAEALSVYRRLEEGFVWSGGR